MIAGIYTNYRLPSASSGSCATPVASTESVPSWSIWIGAGRVTHFAEESAAELAEHLAADRLDHVAQFKAVEPGATSNGSFHIHRESGLRQGRPVASGTTRSWYANKLNTRLSDGPSPCLRLATATAG